MWHSCLTLTLQAPSCQGVQGLAPSTPHTQAVTHTGL